MADNPSSGKDTRQKKTTAKKKSPESSGRSFFVAGIGSSAGGLDAIQEFMNSSLSELKDISFILLQHMSSDHKSLLPEILDKRTPLPVVEVENNMVPEPGKFYIVPAGYQLTIYRSKLKLHQRKKDNILHYPIDRFFTSLAKSYQERAVGIVLSGTGSDGTKGIKAIKEKGGIAIVQNPESAKFDGMPNSAIATGFVDHEAHPSKIGEEIKHFIDHYYEITNSDELKQLKDDETLKQILLQLKDQTNYDFLHYKFPTLRRRIFRRMALNRKKTLKGYLTYLKQYNEEAQYLAKDFLIGVTQFFRNEDAFESLRINVIRDLVREWDEDKLMKIWVVGCATGEEVYSIAILLEEAFGQAQKQADYKIFATDIDEEALKTASAGAYNDGIASDLDSQYVEKYFRKEDGKYVVNQELRKKIIFSYHNILDDPPFFKMNLVSCRNLLIYMQPELQKRVLKRLFYALKYNSYLFLGSSENIPSDTGDYRIIDKKNRIYQNKSSSRSLAPELAVSNELSMNRLNKGGHKNVSIKKVMHSNQLLESVNSMIFSQFEIACIIIKENFRVTEAYGAYGKYMQLPAKHFTYNLLKMVNDELSIAIGSCFRIAQKKGSAADKRSVVYSDDKQQYRVAVSVSPLELSGDSGDDFYMVILEEQEHKKLIAHDENGQDTSIDEASAAHINDLRNELMFTKENLQATIEELETSNEELQTTNEELISSNEELQSTNEELQSVNEELHTVNSEYQDKIKELARLNDDMDNLLKSTEISTLFLDLDLNIRKFTPAISEQLNVIDGDIGRPVSHISHNLEDDVNLQKIVDKVLSDLIPDEREVLGENKECYLMRTLPYITKDKVIQGAVITFVDITEVRNTADELAETNEALKDEISERKAAERIKEVLIRINNEVNQANSFHDGMKVLLKHICLHFNFDLGMAWSYDDDDANISLQGAYYSTTDVGQKYWTGSKNLQFNKGEGLIGRIWESGKPHLIEDLREISESKFHRKKLALKHDLKFVIGVPVEVYSKIEVVLTFYKQSIIPNGEEVKDIISSLVQQLSPLLRSQQINETLRQTNYKLEKVSERLKQKANELKASEEKWSSLFLNANQVISLLDTNNIIQSINHLHPRLKSKGGKVEDYIGRNYLEFFPEEEHPRVSETIQTVKSTGTSQTIETESLTGIFYEISYIPWKEGNEIVGVVTIVDDITDRKKLERENERTTKALIEQNKELEEFAFVVAHDLKSPIANLKSLLNVFRLEGFLTEENDEIIKKIKGTVNNMRSTIETLNEVIDLKQNIHKQDKKVVLEELLDKVKESIEASIIESGAVIISNFSKVPEITYPPAHLRSIFQNLLTNSIKYRKKDTQPEIKVKSGKAKGYVYLEFTDNGKGIDLKMNGEKLFGLFKRLDRNGEGKGIGLYIVKSIVESDNGFIEVDSNLGEGTFFRLYLYPYKSG